MEPSTPTSVTGAIPTTPRSTSTSTLKTAIAVATAGKATAHVHADTSTGAADSLPNGTNAKPQQQQQFRHRSGIDEIQNATQTIRPSSLNQTSAMEVWSNTSKTTDNTDPIDATFSINADVIPRARTRTHTPNEQTAIEKGAGGAAAAADDGDTNNMMNIENTVILAPSGKAVADNGGRATSETYAMAIIKANTILLYKPDSVAVAGAGGVAHAQADLDLWIM